MVDIQSPTAEIRRGKKERRRKKKKPQDENIMVCPMTYGDHKNKSYNLNSPNSPTPACLQRRRWHE